MTLRWTHTAGEHLTGIQNYHGNISEHYAAFLVQKIYDGANLLVTFPWIGIEIPNAGVGVRRILVEGYRVYYVVENEIIHITAIIHQSQSIEGKDLSLLV